MSGGGWLSRRYMGVTAFVGMPGSGKTYGLAEVGARAILRGERVYCNRGFDLLGAEIIDDWEGFASVTGPCVVVWDELPLYFNSRRWSEFPDGFMYRLTQVRKDGIKLYYSAIDEAMIDTNIRRMTFFYWHCRAVTGRILRRSLYPPEAFRKAKARPYRREWVFVREGVSLLYDTDRRVELPARVLARYGAGVPALSPGGVSSAVSGGVPSGVPDAADLARTSAVARPGGAWASGGRRRGR